jgi:hypothetical protein
MLVVSRLKVGDILKLKRADEKFVACTARIVSIDPGGLPEVNMIKVECLEIANQERHWDVGKVSYINALYRGWFLDFTKSADDLGELEVI